MYSHLLKSDLDRLIENLQSRANRYNDDFEEYGTGYRNFVALMNVDTGAWQAGMIKKKFIMTNDEFATALCNRNTFENNIFASASWRL